MLRRFRPALGRIHGLKGGPLGSGAEAICLILIFEKWRFVGDIARGLSTERADRITPSIGAANPGAQIQLTGASAGSGPGNGNAASPSGSAANGPGNGNGADVGPGAPAGSGSRNGGGHSSGGPGNGVGKG